MMMPSKLVMQQQPRWLRIFTEVKLQRNDKVMTIGYMVTSVKVSVEKCNHESKSVGQHDHLCFS